jgi:hypothetical protein
MLPRPATIAAPPSTASPASWNPAVPPPPVTGAALGTGLGVGLGEGSGLGLSDADGLAEALVVSDELALALWLVLSLVLDEAPPLAVLVTPAEPLAVGRNVDGGVEEEPEVQAESATQASMVVRPQPTTVSRTRCDVPAMAVRAFIGPPRVLGNDHFPVAGRRNRRRKGKTRGRPLVADRVGRKNVSCLNGKPGLCDKQAMACSPSEY